MQRAAQIRGGASATLPRNGDFNLNLACIAASIREINRKSLKVTPRGRTSEIQQAKSSYNPANLRSC